MVFCNADFQVSQAPVASIANQTAAKSAVNDVARRTSNIHKFAAELKRHLDSSMGLGWHIIVGADFSVDLRYRKGACVLLCSKTSKMKVLLYRTTLSASRQPILEHEALTKESEKETTKRQIVVLESDMGYDMKNVVIEKVKRLYNFYKGVEDNEAKIAQALKHSMTFTYGPTWQVVVSSSHDLCCVPIADESSYAYLSVAKLRVVLYRHAGTSFDRQLDSAQFGKLAALVLAIVCLLLYGFLSLNLSDAIQNCKDSVKVVSEDMLVNGVVLLEGCSVEDVKRANNHAWWKTAAILGMTAFTMIASLIRMYIKSLTSKVKRS